MDRVAVSVPHPGHMGQITDTRGFPPMHVHSRRATARGVHRNVLRSWNAPAPHRSMDGPRVRRATKSRWPATAYPSKKREARTTDVPRTRTPLVCGGLAFHAPAQWGALCRRVPSDDHLGETNLSNFLTASQPIFYTTIRPKSMLHRLTCTCTA
jgi:hypothetical protein